MTWARAQEREIDSYLSGAVTPPVSNDVSPPSHPTTTVGDVLERYLKEVTPTKRGASSETYRVRQLLDSDLAQIAVSALTGAHVATYRDARLKKVKPPSVRRELAILRHALELTRREWGFITSENVARLVTMPSDSRPRERRLTDLESARLLYHIKNSPPYLAPLVALAIETGMRRGELLNLEWRYIEFESRTLHIPKTKNGYPRTIPLSRRALSILAALNRANARVFPVSSNAVRLSWERLRKNANLTDLRLHDLRHEAISRFFEIGLTIPEVALISGHRDYRMLARYTHLKPAIIAARMDKLTDERSS